MKINYEYQLRHDYYSRIRFVTISVSRAVVLIPSIILLTLPLCSYSWKYLPLVALSSSTSGSTGTMFPTHRPLLAIITEPDSCHTDEKMQKTYDTINHAVSTNLVDLVSVRLSHPILPSKGENNISSNKNKNNNTNDDNDSDHDNERNIDEVLLLFNHRACALTEKLVQLSKKQQERQQQHTFKVVCSSDLVSVAVRSRAHGIHVKEHHLDRIPQIVDQFEYPIVIGTSTHSVESAVRSYDREYDDNDQFNDGVASNNNIDDKSLYSSNRIKKKIGRIKPHYYFVGTCYMTASHPEKVLQTQLEGPELPGIIKQTLLETAEASKQQKQQKEITILTATKNKEEDDDGPDNDQSYSSPSPSIDTTSIGSIGSIKLQIPRIFAIGGIDETNCHEPVAFGADGVAVIRAVLQASHPNKMVENIQRNMMNEYTTSHYSRTKPETDVSTNA